MIGIFVAGLGLGGLVASVACLVLMRAANFFVPRTRIPRSVVRRRRRFAALNTELQRELMATVLRPASNPHRGRR